MYIYIYIYIYVDCPTGKVKQRPTRQWHMGERGLRTKPGFLEPCREESNRGSNMQGGS